MESSIKKPGQLATERFTSKVRLQRNIDLVSGIKANQQGMVDALDYLKKVSQLQILRAFCLTHGGKIRHTPRRPRR